MTLLEAMLTGGSVRSMGELTLVVLGRGRGAIVTTALEYSGVRKWADGRSATGVEYRDFTVFIERFETCIGRAGSSLPTKGHPINLLHMAKEMKIAGLELSDWNLPQLVRDALKARNPNDEQAILQAAVKKQEEEPEEPDKEAPDDRRE